MNAVPNIWELYEKYGFNIIPMNSSGKHPALDSWKHYHGEPGAQQGQRVDPDDLKRWTSEFDKFAVLTGYWSGVVVVDCDSPEAFEFASSFCPPTPMVALSGVKDEKTGWRGRHFYCRHPGRDIWVPQKIKVHRDPLDPSAGKIDMDVKGDGHYVIAPGALHKSGVRYEPEGEWSPEMLEHLPVFDWNWFPEHARPGWSPPPAPGASRTSSNSEDCTLSSYERGRHYIAKRDPAVQGQGGDNHCYATACHLAQVGCSETEIIDLMMPWNQTCVPPFSESDIQGKARRAVSQMANKPKAAPVYEIQRREREREQQAPSPQMEDASRRSLYLTEPAAGSKNQDTPDENPPKAERRADAPRNDGEATAKVVELELEKKRRRKRPVVRYSGNLYEGVLSTIDEIRKLNEPPFLFEKDDEIVQIVPDKSPELPKKIKALSEDAFLSKLDALIEFKEYKKGEWKPTQPPKYVVKSLRADLSLLNLPILERVVTLPQMAPNGHVCDEPGYDPVTRTYYSPLPGLVMPKLPDLVSPEDVEKAKSLVHEILTDYQFAEDGLNWYGEPCSASYANAFASICQGPARSQMRGKYVTPLQIVQAPLPSSGKSKLCRCTLWAATGQQYSNITPMGKDQHKETDNQVITALDAAGEAIYFDNVENDQLNHPIFKKWKTEPYYSGRIMRQHSQITLRNDKISAASINNGTLDYEMARRTYTVNIGKRPEGYQWRHHDLDGWVQSNLHHLAWATRVIVRGWIQAGRPLWREQRPDMCAGRDGARATVDSFEEWGRVMGGIMDFLGIHGFYTNQNDAVAESDVYSGEADEFFSALWRQFGTKRFTGGDAALLLDGEFGKPQYLLNSVNLKSGESLSSRAAASAVGRWLSKHRNQTRRRVTLKKAKGRGGSYYELESDDGGPTGEHRDDSGEHRENIRFTHKKARETELPAGSDEQGELFSEVAHARDGVHACARAKGLIVGDVHPCSPEGGGLVGENRITKPLKQDSEGGGVCSPDMFSRADDAETKDRSGRSPSEGTDR